MMNRRGFFAALAGAFVAAPVAAKALTTQAAEVSGCAIARNLRGLFQNSTEIARQYREGTIARKIGATLDIRKPMRFVGASRGDSGAYRVIVTRNTLITERQVALQTLAHLNPLAVTREYEALFGSG